MRASGPLEKEATDSCKLSCGGWELNPGPLEKPSVLLIAEPSLQPFSQLFYSAFLPNVFIVYRYKPK